MRRRGRHRLVTGSALQRRLADLVDRLLGGPEQVGVVQEDQVRFERIGAGPFRHDVLQQPSHRLEEREAIAVGRVGAVLLQRFSDRGKTWRDLGEG